MPEETKNTNTNVDDTSKPNLVDEIKDAQIEEMITKETYNKLKASFDNVSSQIAKMKKDARAKLTEEEQTNLALQDLENQNQELAKTIAVNGYEKKLLANDFLPEMATQIATDLSEGNIDSVLEAFAKQKIELEKKLKSEYLKQTPPPSSGNSAAPTYENRLAEARKNNDTISVIRIKQEAADKGITLN